MSTITIEATVPAVTEYDLADIDRLAADILADPEKAALYTDSAATLLVLLAARVYSRRNELREVRGEWISLQADYQSLLNDYRQVRAAQQPREQGSSSDPSR
jgi:hypothetical protein